MKQVLVVVMLVALTVPLCAAGEWEPPRLLWPEKEGGIWVSSGVSEGVAREAIEAYIARKQHRQPQAQYPLQWPSYYAPTYTLPAQYGWQQPMSPLLNATPSPAEILHSNIWKYPQRYGLKYGRRGSATGDSLSQTLGRWAERDSGLSAETLHDNIWKYPHRYGLR